MRTKPWIETPNNPHEPVEIRAPLTASHGSMKTMKPFHVGVKPKLTYFKYADVSSNHITKEDAAKLDSTAKDKNNFLPIVRKYAEGWYVYVGGKLGNGDGEHAAYYEEFKVLGMSEDFLKLCNFASKQDMHFICIDADGTEYQELTEFDWESESNFNLRDRVVATPAGDDDFEEFEGIIIGVRITGQADTKIFSVKDQDDDVFDCYACQLKKLEK
jgi:hypothetical protein